MERSIPEKQILANIIKESPPLPFNLIHRHDEKFGDEFYYDIPEDKKDEVLAKVWPFEESFKPDHMLYNLHCMEFFSFRSSIVIRWGNRDIVVCPTYFDDGGMCIDMFTQATSQNDEYCQVFHLKGSSKKVISSTMNRKQLDAYLEKKGISQPQEN